jgi:hypothetical protein
MTDLGPKRFDQIIKKADEDSNAFFSGVIILIVGLLRAAYTFPIGDMDELFSWTWKVVLFFGFLIPFLFHIWKTSRFAVVKAYREAGAFMTAALKGPATQEMPFNHLWRMREIAWAEHLDQKRALRPAGTRDGFSPVFLVDASGEAILENTRVACAGCGRSLSPGLARELWKERETSQRATRVSGDLNAARHCIACGSFTGRFRTALEGPLENPGEG